MSVVFEMVAPAKVNIYLKITGTLPNGYHKLNTIMQEISISDSITVTIDDSKPHDIVASCLNMPPIPDNKNLCYKAASRYLSAYRNKTGDSDFPHIEIVVDKNIPSEAGLGGGSSDAAAVILALDEYFDNPLTVEELNVVAANTGADTPFFLYGGTAVCEGFGEIITPMGSLAGIPMILIKPSMGVSTPACFSTFDDSVGDSGIDFDEEVYLKLRDEVSKCDDPLEVLGKYREYLVNDLEAPAIGFVPVIADLQQLLLDAGSFFAIMSGSGSSVFGLFRDEEARDKACEEISKNPIIASGKMQVYCCETL